MTIRLNSPRLEVISLVLLGIVLGGIAGIAGTTYWHEHTWKELQPYTYGLGILQHLAFEGEEALEPYLDGNLEGAIYAMQHYTKILQFYRDQQFYQQMNLQLANKETLTSDLILTQLRLGNLYEKRGDHEQAKQSYQRALHLAKELGKEKTIEEWRAIVERIDADTRKGGRVMTGPWLVPGEPPK